MSEQGQVSNKLMESGLGDSSVSLAPQWLADGARGTSGAGWRQPSAAVKHPSTRFDTSNPGQKWRTDEERNPNHRREPPRWSETEGERWSEGTAVSQRNFPETAAAGERWGAVEAPGRGRGRTAEVESWKPRDGADWRAPGDPALAQPRNEWRSDRWGGGPGPARVDSWRSGGRGFVDAPMDGGRGFGAGRGRGMRTGNSFSSLKAGGGGIGGNTKMGRSRALHRYSTDELSRLYRQLLYTGRLKLPADVEKDDPLLFLSDGDFLDVLEQFFAVDAADAAQAFTAHYSALERQFSRPHGARADSEQLLTAPSNASAVGDAKPAGQAPLAGADKAAAGPPPDEWVYKDPQGVVQGPFPKQDIIEWYEAGFFPLDLPVRNAKDTADFRPLSVLLKVWSGPTAPPGFPAADQPKQAAVPGGGQAAAAAGPAKALENGHALNLPDDLHPGSEGKLSAALKQVDIKASAPSAAAPAATDPVIDPALVKRTPSDRRLSQLAAAPGPGPAPSLPTQIPPQHIAPLQQQAGTPLAAALPFGAPGGAVLPTQSEGLDHLPFLYQHHAPQQQLLQPGQHASHPMSMASAFMPHAQILSQDGPLLPHQQPQQAQHGLSAGQGLLGSQPEGPHGPGPAWGHGLPALMQQPPPQQQLGLGSGFLSGLHREEQQGAQTARFAAEAAAELRGPQTQEHVQALTAPGAAPAVHSAPPRAPPSPPEEAPRHEEAAAERVRPETKVAPWVAAAPKPAGTKTLLQIQQEEAERQARLSEQERLQQEQAAAEAAAANPLSSGWAKVAVSSVIGAVQRAKSLKQIQEEEMQQAEAARAAAAQQQLEAVAAAARAGPTLGDLLEHQLGGAGAGATARTVWGGSAAGVAKGPSLREVMQYEESAADLEGGASTEFPPMASALPSQAQHRAVQPQASQQALHGDDEADDDEVLFWDYGVPPSKAGQQAIASTAPLQPPPPPQPAKPARWAAAASAAPAARVVAVQPVPRAAPAANGPVAKPAASVKARPSAQAPPPSAPARVAAPAPPPAAVPAPVSAPAPSPALAALSPTDAQPAGNPKLAGAFREWCQQQMQALAGNSDVTLCEFLLTVEANSEVAEYITMYLGQSAAVSRFSAEFMKRKLAEAASTGKKGKKGKKQVVAAAAPAAAPAPARAPSAGPPAMPVRLSAPAAAAPSPAVSQTSPVAAPSPALPKYTAAATAGTRAAPAPAPSDFPSLGVALSRSAKKDSDWEKIPKASGAGKKKKGKGLKLDSTLLGFGTGTNYSVLEQPE